MLPAKRLNTLLEQSQEFQTDRCLRHSLKTGNGILPPALDPSFLCRDHKCGELTLIDMRQGTFHSFLDHIFSADFFIKKFQTFLEVKIDVTPIGLICHLAKLIESYKKCTYVAPKCTIEVLLL